MKSCELCKSAAARMYCESDQASLCWNCDAKVHSANFLVARHSRTLLCHVCQSATPWNASGEKLGRTVSVCERCVDDGCEERVKQNGGGAEESEEGYDGEDDEYEEEDDGGEEDDEDEDEDDEDQLEEVGGEDEDGDNQVVPWSSAPPPASSSSSSEDSLSRFCYSGGAVSLKRLRENAADLCSDDDHDCSSPHRENSSPPAPAASLARCGETETVFVDSLRQLKRRRTEANRSVSPGSRDAAVVDSLRRLREEDFASGNQASGAIVEICNLSKSGSLSGFIGTP